MRPVVLLALLALLVAGCLPVDKNGRQLDTNDDGGVGSGSGGEGSGSGGGMIPNSAPCGVDADCALAAATCCECPSFAVSASDNSYGEQCSDVTCPMMPTCPTSLVAACVNNTCTAACAPMACQATCANGYATDAAGCLTCACAGPGGGNDSNRCVHDSDCVEVPADCCGCMAGGMDTAVPASQAQAYHDMLGCSPNPNCPPIDACTSGDAPRCVQGSCALVAATEPANACGRPDLPACASGLTCIVNRDPDATMYGVGVCGMP